MICSVCGEEMAGDGFSNPIHCPNADEMDYQSNEPDCNPVECDGFDRRQDETWIEG